LALLPWHSRHQLAVGPFVAEHERGEICAGDHRNADQRSDGRLQMFSASRVAGSRSGWNSFQWLQLSNRGDAQVVAAGPQNHRGADYFHRPFSRQLEDVAEDCLRSAVHGVAVVVSEWIATFSARQIVNSAHPARTAATSSPSPREARAGRRL